MATHNLTGYGSRSRFIFDGEDVPDAGKNADVYAELIQLLDDRSLALIMRDAKEDSKKALQILKEHYMSLEVVKGMNITDKTSKICETCTLGKTREFRSRLPDEKAKLL